MSGYPKEGYYCATTTNALTLAPGPAVSAGATPNKSSDCSGVANAALATAVPGDYVSVSVTFTYTPLFTGVPTVASLLTSPITSTAWQRMT